MQPFSINKILAMHETLIWQQGGHDQSNLYLNLSTQRPIIPLTPPKHKEFAGHVLNKDNVKIHGRWVVISNEAIKGHIMSTKHPFSINIIIALYP